MIEAEKTLNRLCLDYTRYLALGEVSEIEDKLKSVEAIFVEFGDPSGWVPQLRKLKAKQAEQDQIVPGVCYRLTPDGQGGFHRALYEGPTEEPIGYFPGTISSDDPPEAPTEGLLWCRDTVGGRRLSIYTKNGWRQIAAY